MVITFPMVRPPLSTILTQNTPRCNNKAACPGGLALTAAGEIGIMMSHASGGRDAAHSAGGFAHNLRKEVRDVRLTMHIGSFAVTITVKKRGNRHSGK